ncbi:MAG: TrkA family potassium uptake protein [Halodesulfurarchaeum sp.]
MDRTRRRALGYVGLLLTVVVGYTVAYKVGMAVFEGESRSLLESLQIVIETFTTTGYGEDAPWRSPGMLAIVVAMQLTGVFLIFLTLPLFVVPWVERRLQVQPPTSFSGTDHVVICGFSERGEALIDELDAQDVPYVIISHERDRARDLYESGYTAMVGNPELTDTLRKADIEEARAVVLDRADETNATVALSVREVAPDVRLVAFIDDPSLSRYLSLAGVDDVLQPRDLLGRGLADKVTSAITTQLGDTIDIGGDIEIIELPIQRGSELDGVTLAESGVRERTGASIIGAWMGGEFVPNPGPDTELSGQDVLLVSGRPSQLSSLMDLTLTPERETTREVIVAGYGEAGRAVAETVIDAHLTCTVVDLEDRPGVDVVGDATAADTLVEAGIDTADAVIFTLGDDTETVFATLVARDTNSEVEILCRADDTESVPKLYAAGADYVLALATVSGRMLAETILGEDVITYNTQIDVVRSTAPRFEGSTLAEAAVRARTGCTVIAVERNGSVVTDLGPEFRIEAGDELVLAGADEDIATFHRIAGVRPEEPA